MDLHRQLGRLLQLIHLPKIEEDWEFHRDWVHSQKELCSMMLRAYLNKVNKYHGSGELLRRMRDVSWTGKWEKGSKVLKSEWIAWLWKVKASERILRRLWSRTRWSLNAGTKGCREHLYQRRSLTRTRMAQWNNHHGRDRGRQALQRQALEALGQWFNKGLDGGLRSLKQWLVVHRALNGPRMWRVRSRKHHGRGTDSSFDQQVQSVGTWVCWRRGGSWGFTRKPGNSGTILYTARCRWMQESYKVFEWPKGSWWMDEWSSPRTIGQVKIALMTTWVGAATLSWNWVVLQVMTMDRMKWSILKIESLEPRCTKQEVYPGFGKSHSPKGGVCLVKSLGWHAHEKYTKYSGMTYCLPKAFLWGSKQCVACLIIWALCNSICDLLIMMPSKNESCLLESPLLLRGLVRLLGPGTSTSWKSFQEYMHVCEVFGLTSWSLFISYLHVRALEPAFAFPSCKKVSAHYAFLEQRGRMVNEWLAAEWELAEPPESQDPGLYLELVLQQPQAQAEPWVKRLSPTKIVNRMSAENLYLASRSSVASPKRPAFYQCRCRKWIESHKCKRRMKIPHAQTAMIHFSKNIYIYILLHVHTYSYIFSPCITTLRTSILPKSCTCCAARICRDLQCLCVDFTLVACLLGLVATFRRTSHSGCAWTGHTCPRTGFDWSCCSIDRRFLFIHIRWLRTWHEGWRETWYLKNMVMLSFNGSKVWVQRESLEREYEVHGCVWCWILPDLTR